MPDTMTLPVDISGWKEHIGKKQIEREKRLTKSASMPSREVRRIYSRSAFTRRPMDIQPIAKEEPKVNKFAHLDLADEMGFTPLHKAVMMKQTKTVRQLLSRGVDINKTSKNGMSALLFAARHGCVGAIQVLLTSDVINVNLQDRMGWTALHHCAINNHQQIGEMLLVAGADPNKRSLDGELPVDIAPQLEMLRLIKSSAEQKEKICLDGSDAVLRCIELTRKGTVFSNDALGLEIEVTKMALPSDKFFICKRIPAMYNKVALGHSEVLISDVYQFWPANVTFLTPITLTIQCVPTAADEEVVLKINDGEIPLFKEKQPIVFSGNRTKSAMTNQQTPSSSGSDTQRKFSVSNFGRMFVVSRLPKETYKIPLGGSICQHSAEDRLSVSVPKNGLNSDATVSFQLYPVATDIIAQLQKQFPIILGVGPICEVMHTDTEPITRRLVTMTVPAPEDNSRTDSGKMVIVSGLPEPNQIEIIEKCVTGYGSVEFLTRYLLWKVAVLVKYIDHRVLQDVCEAVRRYTRKRMQFVRFIVAHKVEKSMNQMKLALEVVRVEQEATAKNILVKQGFTLASITRTNGQLMLCEGECVNLVIDDLDVELSVFLFSKLRSSRIISTGLPKRRQIYFTITSQTSIACATRCYGEMNF